ncbi:ATP-dependent DNA helicase [Candidatus Woesearchaeota archaeon]|nr:ATP-dependent DNA helicase [Candidatus Woesearchaeota archaeon]
MSSGIFFPHEKIRPVQDELINLIDSALKNKQHAIIHAPTGLGKTAASLSPALFSAVKNNTSIFFLTSRHTQHKIIIDTLKEIKKKFELDLVATSIIGKKWMCLQPGAEIMMSGDFSEYCKSMREENKCEFYINAKAKDNIKRENVLEEIKKISPVSTEKIIQLCKKNVICPYELSLLLASKSKVIVSDYYYLFNPSIRENFLSKINKSLHESVIIIDEGHNLPSRIRSLLTKKLSDRIIKRAIRECKKYDFDELAVFLIELESLLYRMAQELSINDEKLVKKESFIDGVKNIKNYEDFIEELKASAEIVREQQKTSSIGWTASFLESWPLGDVGFSRILTKNDSSVILTHHCLDPSMATKDIIDSSLSTIMMSGTLSPVDMYKDLLGFSKETITKEFSSPFPKKNMLALVIPKTTTKFTKRNQDQFLKIANICADIVDKIPGNAAIFFPSYYLRNEIAKFLETRCKKTIFSEQPKLTKEEKQELLERFCKYDNAVLLGVAAGSFGEGIDLPGVLKSVIIVGLPLDRSDLETKELIAYYDKKFSKGWDYGYIMPALTKTMQNSGRCIRSEKDRGVLIFLDERYTWPNYFRCFPSDWNLKISINYLEEIKNFFAEQQSLNNTTLTSFSMADEKEDYLKPEPTSDETQGEIQEGAKDADTTTEEGREDLLENDEISPEEEAFAEGAEEKGELGVCAYCGKPLSQDQTEIVEREINGEKVWFCCDECASKGKKAE